MFNACPARNNHGGFPQIHIYDADDVCLYCYRSREAPPLEAPTTQTTPTDELARALIRTDASEQTQRQRESAQKIAERIVSDLRDAGIELVDMNEPSERDTLLEEARRYISAAENQGKTPEACSAIALAKIALAEALR